VDEPFEPTLETPWTDELEQEVPVPENYLPFRSIFHYFHFFKI
jgi:hypothetical protein